MTTRTNLCTNPSFETDVAGWSPYASVLAQASTVGGRSGAYALQVTRNITRLTVTYGTTASAAPNAFSMPVVAGQSVTVSMYIREGLGALPVFPMIFWQSASAYQSSVEGTAVTVNETWQRISVTAVAPAGAVKFGFGARVTTTAAGQYLYIDDALAEVSDTLGDYYDGSTAKEGYTYAWTGVEHSSTATEATVVRTNLATNPSYETDTTGVAFYSCSGNSNVEQAYTGTKSLKVTFTGTLAVESAGPNVPLPATSGLSYTYSRWVYVPSGNTPIKLQVQRSGMTTVSSAASTLFDTWERLSITFTPTSTASHNFFIVNAAATTTGNHFYTDGFLLEQTPYLLPYFDGSTSQSGNTYAWTGTAHGSTSTASPLLSGINSALTGAGELATNLSGYKQISSGFSGAGNLDTAWKDYRNLYSSFSGSGALTTLLGRVINSGFSGSGTLSVDLLNKIRSDFAGSGTLSTHLLKKIRSDFSGAGSLATGGMVPPTPPINSGFAGSGLLGTALALTRRFTTHYGSEGVLFTELGYVVTPAPLGTSPLGKLSSFTVNTAAVPANPAEGSGSTPSVSASYIKGLNPEFALGETNVLKNGAIGTYEGEIVSLGLSTSSAAARISMDTLLTPLNVDMHLFPFIDGVPGLWTAARALDYWTQQAGVFYDKVPGDVIAYASGFGHTDAFGASTTARFYERLASGATTTQVVNGRSVKTLGPAVTGTTAFHEDDASAVAVSLPKDRKLVFSTGLGLLGTGRTSTVRWNFLDSKDAAHTVSLEATSAGAVMAKIGTSTIASASVPAGATYRLVLSLERLSSTALVAKLTVHTDDLAGTGTLLHDGDSSVADYALPGVMRLTSLEHVSAGGSGAQMTRWGAYLTVAASHPMELPAVQKVLGETKKPFGFVSGFEGNVWNLLNEFCSIAKLDVRFLDGALHVSKRTPAISVPGISWSQFEVTAQRREKYKQVAVVNKQSKAVATDDAVLWRADSVFSVAAREVFETTVQTPHSILNVVQPVAVDGILPFPYIQGGGQYVVTGADGYIIAPAWWNDNGGKVEVSLTGKEGEIAIKITAPTLDTVRAPYRISEGAADRPALYVCGSGILNDPKEVHVNTGAKNAREGFDSVFESPFVAGVRETYDTAAAMAHEYSAGVAEVQYALPNDFETPTGLGQYPAGTLVTDNSRNFRIMDASQTHSKVSGNAVPHTTIGAYVASYPEGATIRDEKARHAGRTIRKFNIKPLKGDA